MTELTLFAPTMPEVVQSDIKRYLQYSLQDNDTKYKVAIISNDSKPIDQALYDAAISLPATQPIMLAQLARILKAKLEHIADKPLHAAEGWQLDVTQRRLWHETMAPIELADKEASLLAYLIRVAPESIENSELLKAVWGYDASLDTHTLQTHIYRLRQKLEHGGLASHLQTVEQGYCWAAM